MMDQQNELRRVNWNEVFSFTHIFKSFRMAIHPSKLLLALAAIVLVYVWGAWVLDNIWSAAGQRVRTGEIVNHACLSTTDFDKTAEAWKKSRPDQAKAILENARKERSDLTSFLKYTGYESQHFRNAMAEKIREFDVKNPIKPVTEDTQDKETWSEKLTKAKEQFGAEMAKIQEILKPSLDLARDKVAKDETLKTDEQKAEALKSLSNNYQVAQQAVTIRRVEFERKVTAIVGERIFANLLDYEGACAVNAIKAVRYGNITGGLSAYRRMIEDRAVPSQDTLMLRETRAQAPGLLPALAVELVPLGQRPSPLRGLEITDPLPAGDRPGFLYWGLMALQGVCWLVTEHWLYALLLGAFKLAVWALFGGAIFRIAALHAAREEKISMMQALRFSAGKFFSFFTAPLIPAAIILVLGVLLTIGGLLVNIPWAGPILAGVLFFLAVVAGLLIAFLSVGLVAGYPLMYPTIAVEGSDSFDAISRSFSYVFARPWRALLYALIALFYGVITFVFVRLFAFVALAATHCFVKWGVFRGGETLSGAADELDVLWTAPTIESLRGQMNCAAMTNCGEVIGGAALWVWVSLVAALTVAYLLSFFASSSTVIYYLLRRKVDATDLDDVYVEEAEEQPAAVAPPGEAQGEAKAPPAEEKPAQEKPADQAPVEEKTAQEKAEDAKPPEERKPPRKRADRRHQEPKDEKPDE